MTTATTQSKSNGKNKVAAATAAKTAQTRATKPRKTASSKTRTTTSKTATKSSAKAPARRSTARLAKTTARMKPDVISYEKRYQMIQEAAYHIAEEQNFVPDNELEHWLQAETKIDNWIKSRNIRLSS